MNDLNATIDILLVEDNATDAELCMRVFQKHGLTKRLVWVKDGAEALDLLCCNGVSCELPQNHRPRVIILDLKLPRVSGLEVLRRVRIDERLKFTPIVILTSSQEYSDIKECYRLGANSFVTKPVEFDRYAETVLLLGTYWLNINKPLVRPALTGGSAIQPILTSPDWRPEMRA